MNSPTSLTAKAALLLSTLNACNVDLPSVHVQYVDAAVNDISGEISGRAVDAGIRRREPDTAVDIPEPVTCETFEQVVAKGPCASDIAKTDASTLKNIDLVLKELTDLLSTTYAGVIPTTTPTNGHPKTNPGKKIIFSQGDHAIELLTQKVIFNFELKGTPSYSENDKHMVNIMDKGSIVKQVIWSKAGAQKYPGVSVAIDSDVCGDYSYNSIEQGFDGKMVSTHGKDYPFSQCTPDAVEMTCTETGAMLHAFCTDIGNPDANNQSYYITQEGGDESKLIPVAERLQEFKDLMKIHGVNVDL